MRDTSVEPIDVFSGNYYWLSNFWQSPIVMGELTFPSNEHAYQAAKSKDPADWQLILNTYSPGQVKRIGRKIKIRADWEDIKLDVMTAVTAAKYDQNPALKGHLMRTKGRELIEGNHWGDTFWGVCKGVGQNHLGKILMAYRDGPQESIIS